MKFPNIDFVYEKNNDLNIESEIKKRIVQKLGSDIIVFEHNADSFIKDYCLDLSSQDFVSNYSNSLINNISFDGKVYLLPYCGVFFWLFIEYRFMGKSRT